MSGADDGTIAPQAPAGEPERPVGTLDLLAQVRDVGPRVLTPAEARRILCYIADSERSRASLRMQVADGSRRQRQAADQLVAYREAAADREAELEQHAARAHWRMAETRRDMPWGLLEEVERLYRVGAGPEEWAQVMGRVGAALLGGVR